MDRIVKHTHLSEIQGRKILTFSTWATMKFHSENSKTVKQWLPQFILDANKCLNVIHENSFKCILTEN